MPRPQDDNFEADSSDVSQIDDGVIDTAADSSAATGDNAPPKDMLSIVRDVVTPKEADPAGAAASPADSAETTDPSAEGAKADDADDFSDVPFNQHPRWKQILTQRNEARSKAETFKQDAEQYQKVQTFIDDHGLTANEAADFLVVAALAKLDPPAAWEAAKPFFQKLVVAAGVVLPPDIKQMVDAGQMSREAAAEVSKARAQVASVQAKQQWETQRTTQRQTVSTREAFTQAGEKWVADRRSKDPNFGKKEQLVAEKVTWLQRSEGYPKTPEEWTTQLAKAYKLANASLTPTVLPAPSPRTQPRPVTNGTVAADARPKPNSLIDIVRQNRAQA